jgi:hypothetical protein
MIEPWEETVVGTADPFSRERKSNDDDNRNQQGFGQQDQSKRSQRSGQPQKKDSQQRRQDDQKGSQYDTPGQNGSRWGPHGQIVLLAARRAHRFAAMGLLPEKHSRATVGKSAKP